MESEDKYVCKDIANNKSFEINCLKFGKARWKHNLLLKNLKNVWIFIKYPGSRNCAAQHRALQIILYLADKSPKRNIF